MNNYNPDILTCLANLSNDEVFTPPALANQMLDLLPESIWSDPKAKFLDPCAKTGVFLREIAKRLLIGLSKQIPDLQDRINHIFTSQLYGISITELTSYVTRRTLYCTMNPQSKYSICTKFNNPQGNILYRNEHHVWDGAQCRFCGVNRLNFDRDDSLESYAYPFIHITNPNDLFNMTFDVIIGNPPYSMKDGGGRGGDGAKQIFNCFVDQAKKMNPRYLLMVIPARWYSGGKGLDSFRDEMLSDNHISELHDFPDTSECFPGKNIRGGICYFRWERNHSGDCHIVNHIGGKTDSMYRPIKEEGCDVFIRSNKAISILQKVLASKIRRMGDIVSARNPFMIVNDVEFTDYKVNTDDIKIYQQKGRIGYMSRKLVPRNQELIDKYLVITAKASPGGDDYPHSIISSPKISEPGSACTETFLVIDKFNSEEEAMNLVSYMKTKFFRFMMFLVRNGQNLTRSTYMFVPYLDFSRPMSDEELYKMFDLSSEEIEYISEMIRPME